MIEPISVTRKDVAAIVEATFPTYRGRKIKIEPRASVTLQGLNWSGGSRSQYAACSLDGRALGNSAPYSTMHPHNNHAEGASVPIQPGCVMVEHVTFCGKDLGLRIYVNPADMPRLLGGGDTYTVCEDQPTLDRWDVEIRTFPTRAKAEAFMAQNYNAKERAGEDDMCVPHLRNDASGEYV